MTRRTRSVSRPRVIAGLAALTLFAFTHCRPASRGSSELQERAVEPGTLIDAFSDEGALQQFRIDSVDRDPRDPDGDVYLYGVSIFDPSTKTWQPYCLPDAEGRRAVVPVGGSWSQSGEPQSGRSDAITFACTSGAIAKCIRFGYKPWAERRGIPLAPYHSACIRMVRADYCGDGRAHTQDGTNIDVWDPLGIQTRDQPEGKPQVFEAAWRPEGAAYLNLPRWSDDIATIVRECPKHLEGRTSEEHRLSPGEVQKKFGDALIFNARFLRAEDRRSPLEAP